MTDGEVTILLVEDDAGHARLIEKNLRRAGVNNALHTFSNGREVLAFLSDGAGGAQPRRYLILLDLNMPHITGYQVLERIKNDARTRSIPVVVLTTTDDAREVDRCYELGCNLYMTKPVDYEQFSEAVRRLGLFLGVLAVPTTNI